MDLDLPLVKSVVGHFLRLIMLLVLVATGIFVLFSSSPVDPICACISNDLLHVSLEQYAHIVAHWGSGQSLWECFGHWFLRVLQGDLGHSMLFNAPVASVIKEHFSTSFILLDDTWLLSGILGMAVGFVTDRYLNRQPDEAICHLSYLSSSLPTFWTDMLLLALFAVRRPVFPICYAREPDNNSDMAMPIERLRHLILPICVLSLLGLGQITLHTQESIASIMKSEFVRFACSQGDEGWSLSHHQVLRHAVTPVLCLQFASLGELLEGALLAEEVLAYPGLGQATIDAGLHGDLPSLMGIVLLSIVLVLIGSSLSTWLVRMLDCALERSDAPQPDTDANSSFVLFQLPVIHYSIRCHNAG